MSPPVTFSTLACPGWSIEAIIANASAYGYHGIEWRGGEAGHVRPALAPLERRRLRRQVDQAGLFSLAVTAYTSFVSTDRQVRAANQDNLRRHLDLADDIGAQYVRAFVGELDPNTTAADVYAYVVDALQAVLPYAHAARVGIALEHHDDFVLTSALLPILKASPDPMLGAVWDIANAYSAGEDPDEGAANLQGRIFYVQVKDGVGRGPDWRLTDVGAGEVPLRRAFELLRQQQYTGSFSVEWEYAWHPELDPPEVALPRALDHVHRLLNRAYDGAEFTEVRENSV